MAAVLLSTLKRHCVNVFWLLGCLHRCVVSTGTEIFTESSECPSMNVFITDTHWSVVFILYLK